MGLPYALFKVRPMPMAQSQLDAFAIFSAAQLRPNSRHGV
jgi:hypothetical protein